MKTVRELIDHKFCRSLAACALSSIFFFVGCGGGGESPAEAPLVNAGDILPSLTSYNLMQGAIFGTATWPEGSTTEGGRGLPTKNVTCLVNENYHVHAHLTIIENGTILAIPQNIGLQGCAYEVHTHDSSGVIHVETQNYHRITLGDFFAVWGRPLSTSDVAGRNFQPTNFYVLNNGKLVHYTGDPAEIELTSHLEVTIVLGKVPTQIPTFQWPAGL